MKKYVMLLTLFLSLLIAPTAFANNFSDVPANSELDIAIAELRAKQVISGYADGTFKPNNQVTRGQLAKMIAVSLKLQAPTTGVTFSDVPQQHPNYDYVQALVGKQIVNGYPDGTFKPNAVVTRSQAAKMIAAAYSIPHYSAPLPFTDVKPTSERYGDIQALYFNGIAGGTSATTYDPTRNVTRGQAALFIYRAWQLQQGAVVKEMTVSGQNAVTIVHQDGHHFKTVAVQNKVRILPLKNGTGTIFVKGDQDDYVLYEVTVANKKATLTAVDWHNYIDIQLNYYTFSSLQLPFPVQRFEVRNGEQQVVASDHYFIDYNDQGIEMALLLPGDYTLTFYGENGATKSYKLVSSFSKMTLQTVLYL